MLHAEAGCYPHKIPRQGPEKIFFMQSVAFSKKVPRLASGKMNLIIPTTKMIVAMPELIFRDPLKRCAVKRFVQCGMCIIYSHLLFASNLAYLLTAFRHRSGRLVPAFSKTLHGESFFFPP